MDVHCISGKTSPLLFLKHRCQTSSDFANGAELCIRVCFKLPAMFLPRTG